MAIGRRFIHCMWSTADQPEPKPKMIRREISLAPNNGGMVLVYEKPALGGRKLEKHRRFIPKHDLQLFPGGLEFGLRNPHQVRFACMLVKECQASLYDQIDNAVDEIGNLQTKVKTIKSNVNILLNKLNEMELSGEAKIMVEKMKTGMESDDLWRKDDYQKEQSRYSR